MEHSLCRSSIRGTWRGEGSFTGDVKKALEAGISLHGGPAGDPGGCSFTRDLCREEGFGNGHLSP